MYTCIDQQLRTHNPVKKKASVNKLVRDFFSKLAESSEADPGEYASVDSEYYSVSKRRLSSEIACEFHDQNGRATVVGSLDVVIGSVYTAKT